MGKDIGRIYKHIQSKLSIVYIKAPVSSSSESQKSSAIKLTTPSVSSARDKHQNNSVLYSQNTIQNDATITKNDNIKSCETQKKTNFNILTIKTPNYHSQRIDSKFSSILNSNTPTILHPVGK